MPNLEHHCDWKPCFRGFNDEVIVAFQALAVDRVGYTQT
jgi:hypothetical protein